MLTCVQAVCATALKYRLNYTAHTMQEHSWGPEQLIAIDAVSKWLKSPQSPQIFRLFGYAGTGKTTLARYLASGVKGRVLYAAYTGKASVILRQKGCANASTIHSLIYKRHENTKTGEVTYSLNRNSDLQDADLLIVDEVSMVSEELAKDLMSFKTKILVLGDPAQLPPVTGSGYFINATPDAMLTEVHRQAADNPIIRMSMEVRMGRRLQVGLYGESFVINRADLTDEDVSAIIRDSDQLLCGTNATRKLYNRKIRAELKHSTIHRPHQPVIGDRLVCLRNDRKNGLLNGSLWDVVKCNQFTPPSGVSKHCLHLRSADQLELTDLKKVYVADNYFAGTEDALSPSEVRQSQAFDYGYALTVHKSQGSQWDKVVLFDESNRFGDTAVKHLYTAITRAAKSISIIVG